MLVVGTMLGTLAVLPAPRSPLLGKPRAVVTGGDTGHLVYGKLQRAATLPGTRLSKEPQQSPSNPSTKVAADPHSRDCRIPSPPSRTRAACAACCGSNSPWQTCPVPTSSTSST